MNSIIYTAIQNSLLYIKKHPQLIASILLIILVPTAFIFSGQQFLNAGKNNQERLEKERIGILHDVFASYLQAVDFDAVTTQSEIEHLISINPDITEFVVARDDETAITIIASSDTQKINTQDTDTKRYRISNVEPDETLITPYVELGNRFWQSYRLVRSKNGVHYYIFTKTSLAHIDSLFSEHIRDAYYWLCVMLAIVLIFFIRQVRMIDYAYLYQQTKKANEMKDMFTNMIAHELRAPLTAIRGYASMIRQKDNVDDEIKTFATRIEDSSERLVTIIGDLLDVARIQSGKMSIEKSKISLQPLIDSVLDAMRPSALEKNIELKKEGTRADIFIIIDGKRLHQALTNLISNAIKYTPSGSISLDILDLGSVIELRVKDTGMGISAENQKKLFAPFFRVNRTEVDSITGTGLGMWITKQLIELMGGSIGIESIKGVGTNVVVTLPK